MEYAFQEVVGFGRDGETAAEIVWIAEVGTEGMVFIMGDGPRVGRRDEVQENDTKCPNITLSR